MIRSADVRTDSEAQSWEARLNRERPQRREAADWIASRINDLPARSPRIVELACGAGFLAEVLKKRLPAFRYCGFDLSPHLLEFAGRRLEEVPDERGGGNVLQFLCADLVCEGWTSKLAEMGWAGKVDAIVSIQALHDLGKLTQQKRVLKLARGLLHREGLLTYGDLLFDDEVPHPSRFSREEHEEMLRDCGFSIPGTSTAERVRNVSGPQGYAFALFGDFGTFSCRK